MARSHKPLLWLPFAAGGTIAALLLPGLLLFTLLASLGVLPADALSYSRVSALASHWIGAVVLFIVLTSMLWHAAHRLRMTIQDLGARTPPARQWVARTCYGLAAVGTLILLIALAGVS
ncbi:MAG TPA: fumarate reductase subunit FrdD [Gammaproteobacteria bacterium]|nr:fumarate reductase subunit FrdD [Gammaproteobacteria bacterium]